MTRFEIENELDLLVNLSSLVEAYEEIAATRMRKIRSSVLVTREFMRGLTEIFQEVKSSYKQELQFLMQQKRIKDPSRLSLIKRNGKTAVVLLSSNTGLYGDIVQKTYQAFARYIAQTQADVAIVGRLGRVLFQSEFKDREFSYFDFPDSTVDHEAIRTIIEFILSYERIMVFYGQFQNIVTQQAAMLDMYGSGLELEASEAQAPRTPAKPGEVVSRYFFEPSLEQIVVFFEAEIFASIFEQTVHESNLAKFAARMLNLDLATDNIRGRLKRVELDARRFKHRVLNSKQLSSLSGMTLWTTVE